MSATDALLAEYRRLWDSFLSAGNRGPDQAPQQVAFDIARVETKLKAAGIKEPFELVRKREDDIEQLYADVDEPAHADMLIDDIPMAPF